MMINYLSEPHWQPKRYYDISVKWQDWLLHKHSFIERLKNQGVKDPKIIVLKQTWENPFPSERKILQINSRCYALVREVLIRSVEGAWMVARAVFPKETLTGSERQFIHLKNHSLGSILFKYPHLKRSEFEIACLHHSSVWHKKIAEIISISDETLWGRRSLFTIKTKSILLSEVFLPDVFSLG